MAVAGSSRHQRLQGAQNLLAARGQCGMAQRVEVQRLSTSRRPFDSDGGNRIQHSAMVSVRAVADRGTDAVIIVGLSHQGQRNQTAQYRRCQV